MSGFVRLVITSFTLPHYAVQAVGEGDEGHVDGFFPQQFFTHKPGRGEDQVRAGRVCLKHLFCAVQRQVCFIRFQPVQVRAVQHPDMLMQGGPDIKPAFIHLACVQIGLAGRHMEQDRGKRGKGRQSLTGQIRSRSIGSPSVR